MDPRMRAAHQLCQLALAVLNGRAAQILALQFDQIERNKHTVALPANEVEHCETLRISDDGFGVEEERVGGQRLTAAANRNLDVKSLPCRDMSRVP